MKVSELIKELEKYDPDTLVLQDVGNGAIETVDGTLLIEVQEHKNYEIFPNRTPYVWTEFYELKDREKIQVILIS